MKKEKKTLETLKNFQIKKSKLSSLKGGTSTTVYKEVGRSENEYPDKGNGEPDLSVEPIVIEIETLR